MCLWWSQLIRLWQGAILCWEVLGDASQCSDRVSLHSETLACTSTQLPSVGRECWEASSSGQDPRISIPMPGRLTLACRWASSLLKTRKGFFGEQAGRGVLQGLSQRACPCFCLQSWSVPSKLPVT